MIVMTYIELVLMCFGIGMLWTVIIWLLLYTLDRWGLLKDTND
jgi:hypothetical protein